MKIRLLDIAWDNQYLNIPQSVGQKVALYAMKKHLAYYIWNISQYRKNPYTYPEIITQLDGISVGGHRIDDAYEITNLIDTSNRLMQMILRGRFKLDKDTFSLINSTLTRNDAPQPGSFGISSTALDTIFHEAIQIISNLPAFEGALAIFLLTSRYQFFDHGNKRTGLFMMNGWLIQHGYEAISIPGVKKDDLDGILARFIASNDGTELMRFLSRCNLNQQPDE